MKKLISALLCIAMLFSLTAFASTVETPQADEPGVRLTYSLRDTDTNIWKEGKIQGNILVEILNCPDFASCVLTFDTGYYVCMVEHLTIVNEINASLTNIANCSAKVTDITSGAFTMKMEQPAQKVSSAFAQVTLHAMSNAEVFCPTLKNITLYTAKGKVENVAIETIDNTVQNPALYMKAYSAFSNLHLDDQRAQPEQFVCFDFQLDFCPDFESFEIALTYNPDVLELFTGGFPFYITMDAKKSAACNITQAGKATIIGSNPHDYINSAFNPFCFKVIGKGDTDISVELVSFKTADGEVENVKFDADIQNFTVTEVFVKYDLTGDGIVASEDARLALRFAVGLETATDEQRCAVGLSGGGEFTSALARDILRAAVGLSA